MANKLQKSLNLIMLLEFRFPYLQYLTSNVDEELAIVNYFMTQYLYYTVEYSGKDFRKLRIVKQLQL